MKKATTKTKIKNRARKKRNPDLVEAIYLANKNPGWIEIAAVLSSPRKRKVSLSLKEIEKSSKPGDTIVIPGKILSEGEVTKKIKVCAFGISRTAEEKLRAAKSVFVPLKEEIRKNPKAEGIKILK